MGQQGSWVVPYPQRTGHHRQQLEMAPIPCAELAAEGMTVELGVYMWCVEGIRL